MQAKHNMDLNSRQAFSHPQENRTLSHVLVTSEDKHYNSERPPKIPPSFSQFLWLRMTPYGMGYPAGQSGSAVQALQALFSNN